MALCFSLVYHGFDSISDNDKMYGLNRKYANHLLNLRLPQNGRLLRHRARYFCMTAYSVSTDISVFAIDCVVLYELAPGPIRWKREMPFN